MLAFSTAKEMGPHKRVASQCEVLLFVQESSGLRHLKVIWLKPSSNFSITQIVAIWICHKSDA